MRRLTLAALLPLAACVAPQPAPVPTMHHCAPAALAQWVGTDVALAEPRPGVVLRILRPGAPVPADFSPERLTLEVDRKGIVRRATCG